MHYRCATDQKTEDVGFEPTIHLRVYSISNAAPSTARTTFQHFTCASYTTYVTLVQSHQRGD